MSRFEFLIIFLIGITFSLSTKAQNFVEVPNLSISNPGLEEHWTGVAWADVDNDQDLDLFLTDRAAGVSPRKNKLYINQNGNFIQHTSGDLVNDLGFWFGCSWGDVNNDSLIDVYVAGFPGKLYLNQGGGNFTRVSQGAISSPLLAGIGVAMGDLNLDGNLDIVLVRPNWVQGPPSTGAPGSPDIMINSGAPNYTFSRLAGTDVSIPNNDTYLQPTLSDFDGDGDSDLFIGMGSGASKLDLHYENLFSDSARLDFKRIENNAMALDSVEGNHWSFVDIDNDLDLDAFITNWATVDNGNHIPRSNNLYVNQPGGFVKVNRAPITTDQQLTTTICWGDYDNDKDLDAITISDQNYTLKYYQNDGTGNFTSINAGILGTLDEHQSGGSNGDFDNDGDLDLYAPGPGSNAAILRNDLANGYKWVQFSMVGTNSNQSGIGAKVYLKSGGSWQMREVSASSTFFGMNSLRQHFGLANDTIEEVKVKWPSGLNEAFYSIQANQHHFLTEGQGIQTSIEQLDIDKPKLKVYPNPTNGDFKVILEGLNEKGKNGDLVFLNSTGKILHSMEYQGDGAELNRIRMSLESGQYILRFTSYDGYINSYARIIVQ